MSDWIPVLYNPKSIYPRLPKKEESTMTKNEFIKRVKNMLKKCFGIDVFDTNILLEIESDYNSGLSVIESVELLAEALQWIIIH